MLLLPLQSFGIQKRKSISRNFFEEKSGELEGISSQISSLCDLVAR
jgi:hypothetical protein